MKISKQARREAKRLFRICLVNRRLDESRVRQAVARIIQEKPRGYLAILVHFQRRVKLDRDQRSARIESSSPLSPDLQASLQSKLGRIYGPGLNYSFAENRGLIGGLRIRVASDVYDGSVQGRLQELEERF